MLIIPLSEQAGTASSRSSLRIILRCTGVAWKGVLARQAGCIFRVRKCKDEVRAAKTHAKLGSCRRNKLCNLKGTEEKREGGHGGGGR